MRDRDDLTLMSRAELERMQAALAVALTCIDQAEIQKVAVDVYRSADGFMVAIRTGAPALHENAQGASAPDAAPITPAAEAFPAPAPMAAPAARPAAPKPACGHAGASNLRAPGWTADEDATAVRMFSRGSTCAAIGRSLGRSERGVQQRIGKLRKAGKLAVEPTPEMVKRATAERPVPQESADGPAAVSDRKVGRSKGNAGGAERAKAPLSAPSQSRRARQGGERSGPEESRSSPNARSKNTASVASATTTSTRPTGRPDPDNRAKAETRAATPKDAEGMGEAKDAVRSAPEPRPQPMRRDGGRGGQANNPTTDRLPWKPSQIDVKAPTAEDVAQAETDQEILELLAAGNKSGAVAEMLEIPKDVVVARYTSLVPCRSYEGQTKALERVREIVRAGREARA